MDQILSFDTYRCCVLCPRMCRADRTKSVGFCGCTDTLTAARAALHRWEEPCISGPYDQEQGGSGAIFFSGCTLGCCFCQNAKISSGHFGKEITAGQLAQSFLRLQDQGAFNINLVTPTHYLPHIVSALDQVRHRLTIPVLYNCGGYERVETIAALKDYVDIWLPDLKYMDSQLSLRFSQAKDYFEAASAAICQMISQTGSPIYQRREDVSLLSKGVIIRHMVLPGHREDSIALLQWMAGQLPKDQYLVSLMSQYTPYTKNSRYPELNRRITSYEYNKVVEAALELGLTNGFMQERSSAKEEYTPPFNLEGMEGL